MATREIPNYLIYEIINDQPVYYKGYECVVQQPSRLEDIMGSSGLQALIVSVILRFLYKHLSEIDYEIVTNETGLHLDKGNNLATDIAIYEVNV